MKEHRHAPSPFTRVRRSRFFQPLLIAIGLTTFLLYIYRSSSSHYSEPSSSTSGGSTDGPTLTDYSHGGDVAYPPKWDKMAQWQKDLPQHDLNLPYPEGRTGRYLKFSVQIRYLGWNNCLNEMLMNNALAYETGRAYVFNDYWWKHDYYPWPSASANQHDVRTPLNAIISGPTSGMPYDAGDPAPRSVHEDYWELACPPSERVIIKTSEVKKKAKDGEEVIIEGEGSTIWEAWKRKLKSVEGARCVEIVPAPREEDGFPQVFDLWFFGSVHSLSVWDRFRKSPVSRLLKTAGPVNSGIERNAHLFLPVGASSKIGPRDPFERMMAMHVRRGDYKEACNSLAAWNSTYYNWNLLPELPDHFPPPPGGGYGWNTPENIEKYMEHCLPEIPAIVKKARDSRDDYVRTMRGKEGAKKEEVMVDVMYLLTNDRSEWMRELIEALRKDGWANIKTSNDLELDQLQKDVNMAIDMDIARRAAVFIGNGWSSMSSNIVHRRMMDDHDPMGTRFW